MKPGETKPVIDFRGRFRGKKVWVICSVCEIGRWVRIDGTRKKEFTGMCCECHNKFDSGLMEEHPRWKGGKHILPTDYVQIRISPDDPLYSMTPKNGLVYEHRYVVAKNIGRVLKSWEIVHHINGVKNDNRIENLELLPSQKEHSPSMAMQRTVRKLEERIKSLENQLKTAIWKK